MTLNREIGCFAGGGGAKKFLLGSGRVKDFAISIQSRALRHCDLYFWFS